MTITSTTLPYSMAVSFSGQGINTPQSTPEQATITESEFSHDVAVLKYWSGDIDSDALASGMPMLMTYGRPGGFRTFYGYVNHPTRTNNNLASSTMSDRNAVTITCVGASWPMKQTDTKVFTNTTCSAVVAQIAALFNLAANIVPDTTVWPSLQMGGMSYWQFCVTLAQKIGYTFYCNGIQLVFKPRTTNGVNLASLAAVYDYRVNPASLVDFTPTTGTSSPQGGQLANRQLAGINPRTLQPIFSQVSGVPTSQVLGTTMETPPFNLTQHDVVTSQAESDANVNGAAANNQLYITATATATGNAFISQGSIVYVQNANGSQNGLWFVTSAKHALNAINYVTYLTLGRDSTGPTNDISITPQIASPPTAVLTGQLWVVT
jgi:phage protein D